jgi:hypothetical protein
MKSACINSAGKNLAIILLLGATVLWSGCSSASLAGSGGEARAAQPFTGKVFTSSEVRAVAPGAILGETSYAEVNSAWLPQWYPLYRSKLFKIGIVRWDNRFDCNRFADFYSNLAQAFFALDEFHSSLPAQGLALGPFWYARDNGKGRHAVIQALTERGRLFIDPQTGEEMKLTAAETQSGYFQLF